MSVPAALAMIAKSATKLGYAAPDHALRSTLAETIDVIPSHGLAALDEFLAANIAGLRVQQDKSLRTMLSLTHGLIFVRVLEIRRPSLTPRAWIFRDAVLAFLEPIYQDSLKAMGNAQGNRRPPVTRELIAAALATRGLRVMTNTDADRFCCDAVAMVVLALANAVAAGEEKGGIKKCWSALLFAVTFSSHIAPRVGATFEIASSLACVVVERKLLPSARVARSAGVLTRQAINDYNQLTQAGNVVGDIGEAFALWLWEPGDETYAGLEARFAILFGSAMGV
jgi:hypothetical protein